MTQFKILNRFYFYRSLSAKQSNKEEREKQDGKDDNKHKSYT